MKAAAWRYDEIVEALRLLATEDQAVELRGLLLTGGADSEVFGHGDWTRLAQRALELEPRCKGVYVTLNPVNPALAGSRRATNLDDVVRRRWLMVDLDPVRPADVSSTDEEKRESFEVLERVREALRGRGWPDPVTADSGNGYHLLYRIDLPVNDGALVRRVLRALDREYSTARVKIDRTVFNPGRLVKLYGTVVRKGESTAERPHRQACVVQVPQELRVVPRELLEQVAARASSPRAAQAARPVRRNLQVPDLPREEVQRRAAAYVAKMPPAVEGQGGHSQTFAVTCRLVRDFGLTVEEARPILQEYNRRCQPPWEDDELEDADDFEGFRGRRLLSFTNYYEDTREVSKEKLVRGERRTVTEEVVEKVGLGAPVVHDTLLTITDEWPKRCGGVLFAEGAGHRPLWLEGTPALFAWVGRQLPDTRNNQLRWESHGPDKVSRCEFHQHLLQTVEEYDAVEPYPHCPALTGCYYMHPPAWGGDGRALSELLGRFSPATPADRELIKAFFLTLVWGGPPGSRPGWAITTDEPDNRGVGKTWLALMGAQLVGGPLLVGAKEDMPALLKRLLSPEASGKRVVLLDNVKNLKYSWPDLEALVTSPVLSGHRLYQGEGRRPNTLTFVITANAAALSKDMAQRCVVVKLARPKYDPNWEADTARLIEERRWEIIGDLLAELRREAAPLEKCSRWSQWEAGVLARCHDPAGCQKVITERQGEIDADEDEAAQVRQVFYDAVAASKIDPERAVEPFESVRAAALANTVSGKNLQTNQATTYIKSLNIHELVYQRTKNWRGFIWKGSSSNPEEFERLSKDPRSWKR